MNILFIGDFRPAANYGSIATTECLLNMITPLLNEEDEMKIIDRRSYDRRTPLYGFLDKPTSRIKTIVRKIIPQNIRIKLKGEKNFMPCSIEDYRIIEHTPCLFNDFDYYSKEMLNRGGYEKTLLDWADFVFINGEGTIVNGTDKNGVFNRGGRYTLWMSWLAKVVFKKPTCLVNMTVDPSNLDAWEMIKNTFPKIDYLCTREPLSKLKLEEYGVNNSHYVPDALFSYKPTDEWKPSEFLSSVIDFNTPYIVLGDSTALNSNVFQSAVKWDIVNTYTCLYSKLKKVVPQIVFLDGFNGKNKRVNEFIKKNSITPIRLANTDYHSLYHIFKYSSLFISGRWHASVLASLSSTPILLYGADSHKTKALYSILDYKYPFFETSSLPLHLDDIVECSQRILNDDKLRKEICAKVNFAATESYDNILYLKEFLYMYRNR